MSSVDFIIKRGKTEAEISFIKNGNKINPMYASGGGVVDVASFALRIAIWSISNSDNVMILDEPGKWISKDLIPKFASIIKELSEKLKLQFIIVTHIQELTEQADKVFNVKLKEGVSVVNWMGKELKPCPFCGGENLRNTNEPTVLMSLAKPLTRIKCVDCGCEQLELMWNNRTSPLISVKDKDKLSDVLWDTE